MVNIGTNSPNYTPVNADIGSTLRCLVTASNSAGPSTPAPSADSSAVVAGGVGSQSFFQNGCASPMGQFVMPHSIRIGNKTWIAWEAGPTAPRKPMVRTYDHVTGVWTAATQVGTGLNNDDHGIPVLCGPDAAGHVYCFYGCHATPQKISRTTVAGVPTAWTVLPSVGVNVTYPKPYIWGNTIFVFNRNSTPANGTFKMCLSKGTISGGNITWTSVEQILITNPVLPSPPAPAGGSTRHYSFNLLQVGSKVYFEGLISEQPAASRRYNVYVFNYDLATNTFSNVRGTYSTTTFPVSAANFTTHCRVYEGGPGSNFKNLLFDHLGNLFAWYSNAAGQLQEIRLDLGLATWTAPVPLGFTPQVIYKRADGRFEAISLTGDALSLTRRTRTLAAPATAVWGANSAAIWTRERVPQDNGLEVDVVAGGGADGRFVFSERARPWTENPDADQNSRYPQNDLRGYFMSDSGLILS